MKIIQINAVYGFGSTGIIVRDLQDICYHNGIECIVAYSQSQDTVKNGYQLGNFISNKIHALLSRISGKQGYFSILSTRKFLKYLDQYHPDIIHLHNLHGCYINVPMVLKYASRNGISVVVSLHDCWFYTGGCSHYTSVGCSKWLKKCGSCPKRYEETPAYLWDSSSKILKDRKLLFSKISDLVVVGVSKWIVEEANKTVFKGAQCLVITNGIDTNFFHPVKSDFRKKFHLEDKFVILAPANKWFLDVNCETLDYFSSRLTEDMRMVFIGGRCDENRLTDKMINYGFVSSREEIREIYSSADVLLNCTREESLSLLNIEVQACGTPVVTYSNTGVKETVDGMGGYAVDNGNPEAMWNVFLKIKNQGKEYYSEKCIGWVRKQFDKNKNYQKYIDLYMSILN